MKIHSDILTRENLLEKVPAGLHIELTEHGSRTRARAFAVKLSADAGTSDAHGVKRRYSTNSGYHGGDRCGPRAATWVEYGDWMVELFKIDQDAIIGHYEGREDFVEKTQAMSAGRPSFERAEEAADRWSEELFWHHAAQQGQVRITRVGGES